MVMMTALEGSGARVSPKKGNGQPMIMIGIYIDNIAGGFTLAEMGCG